MDIEAIIREYDNNKSVREIAKMFNTYPNKIFRILKKAGKELRTKEEAGKLAFELGKSKPPMLGKKRTVEEKLNISKKRKARWDRMTEDELESFKEGARERWKNIPEEDKQERQRLAGEALKAASVEGSKAEKFLYKNLTQLGFNVIMHKTGLIPGEKYEIDLYLPDLKTVIEIDGPQHFLPIFGEDRLQKTIKYDSIKNGVLLSAGFCVIRIKYTSKHNSMAINRTILNASCKILEEIKTKFPEKQNRFFEVEINDE